MPMPTRWPERRDLRVSGSTLDRLRALAAQRDRTLAAEVRAGLAEHLGEAGRERGAA